MAIPSQSKFNIFKPTSKDDIRVGYISTDRGYIEGLSICDANAHAKKDPGTAFILQTRDEIKYLNINQVNKLTVDDIIPSNIGGTESCGGDDKGMTLAAPCGKPQVIFSGGGGVGAKANAVVGDDGAVIAVDMVAGGFGYKYPPNVKIKDPCNIGVGVVARAYLKETAEEVITYEDRPDFEEYKLCDDSEVNFGDLFDSSGKNIGGWNPASYVDDSESQFDSIVDAYEKTVQSVQNPWFSTRKQLPDKVSTDGKTTKVKYDVDYPAWGNPPGEDGYQVETFMNSHAISPVPKSDRPGSDFAGIPYTFEWEENFPYDGEYTFRYACDNKGSLSIDNDQLTELPGWKEPGKLTTTLTEGLHTIRLDLKNTPMMEKFLSQVARQPTASKDTVKTTTTTSTVSAKFVKSGDSKTEFVLDVGGKGSAEINFWMINKDKPNRAGLSAESIRIESDKGDVIIDRNVGGKIERRSQLEGSGTFTGGKKYKIKVEGATPKAGKPRVFEQSIELLDSHGDDTNTTLTMKKVTQSVTKTTTVTPPKPPSKGSTQTDATVKEVFDTISYIKKADRKLWRTNVYNRGGFLNEYGICPFNTKKTLEGNPYAGVHNIVWQNVNFPIDGNYDIKIAVDDNVKLEFDGPTKDTIEKKGFFDTRVDGKTGRGFTKGTGPSKYVRFFKKGNYKLKAELEQIPGGDFGFELKKPGPKRAEVTFNINVQGMYGNQILIKELDIDIHKAYKGDSPGPQTLTKTVEVGREYEVEFLTLRSRGGARTGSLRDDAIRFTENGKQVNMEDRTGRVKSTDFRDVTARANQGIFYDVRGNKCKFKLGKKSTGINPMALGITISSSFTEEERIAKKSWNENPMGVALTIDAPMPPIPVMPEPVQEGRCPPSPMWSTRSTKTVDKKWHPVRDEGWSPFLNKYGMSPILPLSSDNSDAGGRKFINEWDVDVLHKGWYKLKAEVDDIAKIWVDGDLKIDLAREAGKIRDAVLFPLEKGKSKIKVEVENQAQTNIRCIDKKIFSTRDWSARPPKITPKFEDVNFKVTSGSMFANTFKINDLDIYESKPFTPVYDDQGKPMGNRDQINRTYTKSVEVGRVYDVVMTSDNGQRGYPITYNGLRTFNNLRRKSNTRLEFDDNAENGFDINASFDIDKVSSGLSVKFSQDGKSLVVSGKKGTVTLTYGWNDRKSISGKVLSNLKVGGKTWVQTDDRRGSVTQIIDIDPSSKGVKLRTKGDNLIQMEDHTDNDWTDIQCLANKGVFFDIKQDGRCKYKLEGDLNDDSNRESVSLTKRGVNYEGPRLVTYGNDRFISPDIGVKTTEPTDNIQGKTWNMKWTGINFPEDGIYKLQVEADDLAVVKVDGREVGRGKVGHGIDNFEFQSTAGNKLIEIVLKNISIPGTSFKQNPTVVFAQIEKNVCKPEIIGKPWTENPIGLSAALYPPPCPRIQKGTGVVDRVEIDVPGGGFNPGTPPDGPDTYPRVGIITEIKVPPGPINYDCDIDKVELIPSMGAKLSLCECGPFGKIQKVCVDAPGIGFTGMPRVKVTSKTGINFNGIPIIKLVPPEIGMPPEMLLQVTDLVGVKQTGYYDGKPYYGSVFYEDGVKYAGWYQTPGVQVQIYDTMQESIDAQVTTPPSAILRQGSDTQSNNPRLDIPGTPDNIT